MVSFVVLAGVAKTAKLKRQMSKDFKTNCKFKEDVSLWFMGNTLDLWPLDLLLQQQIATYIPKA